MWTELDKKNFYCGRSVTTNQQLQWDPPPHLKGFVHFEFLVENDPHLFWSFTGLFGHVRQPPVPPSEFLLSVWPHPVIFEAGPCFVDTED